MKPFKRIFFSEILRILPLSPTVKTNILRKMKLYGSIGENVYIQGWKLPLYSELVFLHNNVWLGSNVGLVTHDGIHWMLNYKFSENRFIEKLGCIEIMDNVFIGSNTRILCNTRIGSNVIVGSGSLVTKDIPDNSVYAGVPARYICSFEEYVEKARAYSEHFRATYNIDEISGMDEELAEKIYQNFCKEKDNQEPRI